MEIKEENKEILIDNSIPSLNEIISSNKEANISQVPLNQSSTIESYNPQNQENFSYSKTDLGENDITNIKMDEKENIEEKTEETVKITNRIIKAENSKIGGGTFYEKKIISKIITKESPTDTTIIKTSNILNEKSLTQNHNKATYTRPINKIKYKNPNKNNKLKNNLPKTNVYQSSNLSIEPKFQTFRNTEYSPNKTVISSQSFAGKKIYLTKPEIQKIMAHTHRAYSPDPESVRRKTINRGEEIKNVQITHIICSSKPSNFHITEKLETDNIKSNPIQISKVDREKLKKGGKSSYSSSCQDNIKPKTQNLKGKTTVYQHARGIGMTNDRKGNINPLFYKSEIKKLEPIVKEKEKEKVEYIENFRSSKHRNNIVNSSKNIEKGKNNQYQNFNTESTNNTNIVNSISLNMNNNSKNNE